MVYFVMKLIFFLKKKETVDEATIQIENKPLIQFISQKLTNLLIDQNFENYNFKIILETHLL